MCGKVEQVENGDDDKTENRMGENANYLAKFSGCDNGFCPGEDLPTTSHTRTLIQVEEKEE